MVPWIGQWQLDFDVPDLGEDDFASFHGKATLRIGKAVVTIPSLVSGIPCFCARLDPSKEGLESFVHALQGVLQHLRMDVLVFLTQVFDLRELVDLIVATDAIILHCLFAPLLIVKVWVTLDDGPRITTFLK